MRSLAVSLFVAAVVLCSPCSTCRCSDPKQPAQTAFIPSLDLADLIVIKSLLGNSVQMDSTEHFSILHGAGANYVPGASKTLERAYKQFYETFSQAGFELTRSTDRLVWICFPEQNKFDEYALRVEGTDLSWLDGYYSTLTNRVAVVEPSPRISPRDKPDASVNSGSRASLAANAQSGEEVLAMSADESQVDLARLTHELAHQLAFNSGLQKRGVMYPFWVSEGLATNFELDWLAGPGLASCSTARRDCLVKMYVLGELVPLRQFVIQTKAPASAAHSRRYYAQAWAFFQFLLTERSDSLRGYLRQIANLAPGQRTPKVLLREFTDALGPPEGIESSWNAFLDRQAQAQAVADSTLLTSQK
jgi:hypothetical protein